MEINSGSKFVRADMRIHSYGSGGSFDVRDDNMTPQNIVDTALANNLSIISITDHNEIENTKIAIDYAKDKSILFVPGIEVSTTQGHLLVYFSSYNELRQFYGNLTISNEKQICSQGIAECLNIADSLGGFGILAHIELESGFEKTVRKFGPHMDALFCHKNLMALEISRKDSVNFYTEQDDQSDAIYDSRMALVKKRRKVLDLDEASLLPKVMFSDSHVLDKLGINAEGDKKLTRFKVDELTFEALKIALQLHESRVRVEELIPERVPRFKALKFKGGLLDGQVIEFSSNLTCIIGGRGTGKSTLVEALCSTSGNESTKDINIQRLSIIKKNMPICWSNCLI
ncbi:MAG: AAA family ATPase [Gammaproteobacteria bacterium]|nr:AAA family ATPase [Gammaproteobacteria bacterium]